MNAHDRFAHVILVVGRPKRESDEDEGYLGSDVAGAGAVSIVLSASCARLLIPADDVPLRPPDSYFPHAEWRTSTPEAQGLDSEALIALFDTIEARYLPIHSLQIVRYGHLVLDTYFFPFLRGERHDVASVTKSITTTLVGVALDRDAIPSLETSVYPLLYPRRRRTFASSKSACATS